MLTQEETQTSSTMSVCMERSRAAPVCALTLAGPDFPNQPLNQHHCACSVLSRLADCGSSLCDSQGLGGVFDF